MSRQSGVTQEGDVQCSCFPVRTFFSLSIERAPIAGDTVFVAIAGIWLGGGVVLEMRGLLIKNKKIFELGGTEERFNNRLISIYISLSLSLLLLSILLSRDIYGW